MEEKSISYAAYKNVATKKRKEILEREIALLEKHLDTDVNNSNSSYHIVAERIFTLKKELENIIEYRRYHQVQVAMVQRGWKEL